MPSTKTKPVVEISIDGDRNEDLHFRPLQRRIRGRFDFGRVAEPQAQITAQEWPKSVVPGQRLGIDTNGHGYVVEPLHDDENTALREAIVDKGNCIAPAVETMGSRRGPPRRADRLRRREVVVLPTVWPQQPLPGVWHASHDRSGNRPSRRRRADHPLPVLHGSDPRVSSLGLLLVNTVEISPLTFANRRIDKLLFGNACADVTS